MSDTNAEYHMTSIRIPSWIKEIVDERHIKLNGLVNDLLTDYFNNKMKEND